MYALIPHDEHRRLLAHDVVEKERISSFDFQGEIGWLWLASPTSSPSMVTDACHWR
ncbi:hypothetical protein PAXRUDRAFT_826971 [Paxillus rubicundulus Ve08.2h10]|uniref:Uncharacterized protein n=1 Tax=Paxillus rubicundulus Ve08.2h10 TaxID=930991 RepID=A0A0D0DDT7_9AGAM|nr:hypothetical protein PAXRUDRAFT_826971 [Paxillus rubicundulus Ve08.2h10]